MTVKIKYGQARKVLLFLIEFLNGILSGIPPCCVFAYARKVGTFQAEEFEKEFVDSPWKEERYALYRYVPCPKCFEQRRRPPRIWNTPILPTWFLFDRTV